MVPRDTIKIWDAGSVPNGSGGRTTQKKGSLVLTSLAQVTELKPTRDQLAEQTKLGKTLKIELYARPNVTINAGQSAEYRGDLFAVQGAPIRNALGTEWTLYAKEV